LAPFSAFSTISPAQCWAPQPLFLSVDISEGTLLDFAASLIGDRLSQYDRKIADNGFAVTLYLRLVFFPYTPLNFGLALTRISFAQFFWGTFFGIFAGGFVMTFFFATITEVWSNGQLEKLWDWKSLFSLILFIASFFIPKVVKHFKPEI
jgi:uncharacterized membrane protein YdjX (TVP38/TMEM64 family)